MKSKLVTLLVKLMLMSLMVAAAVLPVTAQVARHGEYRLRLTASPPQVPADGKSEARIRIEVRTQSGELVAEEVQVVVSATLGELSSDQASGQQSVYVNTVGGIATVSATSTSPGLCTITARVRESRNSTTIRFLAEGEAARPVSKVVHVRGGWVGYSVDYRVIQARDQVVVQLGELSIRAGDTVDVDLNTLTIRAFSLDEGGVVVAGGDSKLAGQQLYFDIGTRRGVICGVQEGVYRRLFFDGYDARPTDTEWELPSDAFSQDMRETYTWMIADSISYFIGDKLVLRHGSAWAGEQRILRFPAYWIVGMPGYTGSTNTDMFSVDSSGGVALDVPFFYSVTDSTTEAIKVQHGTRLGSAATRQGWSLAWENEYRALDDSYQGAFEIAGLPRSNWGVQWQDQRSFSPDTSAYFNVNSPDHRSLFSDASIYRYAADGRYNLRAYLDAPRDHGRSYGLVGDWLSNPLRLDSRKWYRLGVTASARKSQQSGDIELGSVLFSDLDWGTYALGSSTLLRPRVRNQFSWDTSGYRANGLRAALDLTRRLGRNSTVGVGYSAEYFSGDAPIDGLEQILSLDLGSSLGKWYLFASGSHNLTFEDSFAFLDLNYYQSDRWRWQLSGTFYEFDASSYSEWEITVARMFGQQEVGLTYSEETGRLSLLLGGLASF